jgi:outer membrane lipoprotein-sorting protein
VYDPNPAPLFRPAAILLLALLLAVTAGPPAAAADNEPDPELVQLLEQILASQQSTETLRGRFIQVKTLALFKEPERSAGRFSFRQPDLIRLDYESPSEVVLLLEGDQLLTYYPALREAERFDVRKQKKRVFDHLIGDKGIGQLRKNFNIVIGEGPSEGIPEPEGDNRRLRLTPRRRQLKKRIDFIDLWVRAADRAPVQYFIREKSGDTTMFRLESLEINTGLSDDTFRIDLPEDVTLSVRTGKDGGDEEE